MHRKAALPSGQCNSCHFSNILVPVDFQIFSELFLSIEIVSSSPFSYVLCMKKITWMNNADVMSFHSSIDYSICCNMRAQCQNSGTGSDGRCWERLCKSHATAGYRCEKGKATIEELWEEVLTMRSAATITSQYKKATAGRWFPCDPCRGYITNTSWHTVKYGLGV
jgi:hypothetical protein